MELKNLLIALTKENHAKLKMYCASKEISMNAFTNRAIREKMERDLKDKVKEK